MPLRAREPAFDGVVSYRRYRLKDTRATLNTEDLRAKKFYKLAGKLRDFNSSIPKFDGKNPVEILRFLAEFQDACDTCAVSEAAATKLVAYFVHGDAKAFLAAQAQAGKLLGGRRRTQWTWPHAVHALLSRYGRRLDEGIRRCHEDRPRVH